jgi:quercetin dioxygenase-like cupin family protein
MSNIGVWENAEPGVKRKILSAQGGLMVMEVHFEANAEGYEHSHFHEQMDYCMKGSFEFTINGEIYLIKQGESLYIPSQAKHGAKALEPGILLDIFTPVREDLVKRIHT